MLSRAPSAAEGLKLGKDGNERVLIVPQLPEGVSFNPNLMERDGRRDYKTSEQEANP